MLSCGADGTAILWTLADVTKAAGGEKGNVSVEALAGLWSELASDDADKAHEAIFRLIDAGNASAAFLAERLAPIPRPVTDEIRKRIAELDDDQFSVRKRATEELARMGALAEPALRQALAETVNEEVRARVKKLLQPLDGPQERTGEVLRKLRAVHVLARIASPKARTVLRKLSRGSQYADLTRRAAEVLEKLDSTH